MSTKRGNSAKDTDSTPSTILDDHGSIFDHYPVSPVGKAREWEISSIRDEEGRMFVADDTNSKISGRENELEWEVPALRKWPAPGLLKAIGQTMDDGVRFPSPWAPPDDTKANMWYEMTDPLAPHWKTEKYLAQVMPGKTRFYQAELLDEPLIGAENYCIWAEEMTDRLSQCNLWPLVGGEFPPVPVQSQYRTRWRQLNDKAWMMIAANVSREIRRDLCDELAWDARETWYHLQRTCGDTLALTRRSVQGVHDLLRMRTEECTSMEEYLCKMLVCIRAIECNRRGREDDEWLWCQFVLANLGPKWDSWVSELMMKIDESIRDSSLSSLKQLFHLLDTEEARRIRAARFPSRNAD